MPLTTPTPLTPSTPPRCASCHRLPLRDAVSVRRGTCRLCAFPALVSKVRRVLAAGPRKAATMEAVLEGLGFPARRWNVRVRNAADIAVCRRDGVACWALPQHQALRTDTEFHRELCHLLDAEAYGGMV